MSCTRSFIRPMTTRLRTASATSSRAPTRNPVSSLMWTLALIRAATSTSGRSQPVNRGSRGSASVIPRSLPDGAYRPTRPDTQGDLDEPTPGLDRSPDDRRMERSGRITESESALSPSSGQGSTCRLGNCVVDLGRASPTSPVPRRTRLLPTLEVLAALARADPSNPNDTVGECLSKAVSCSPADAAPRVLAWLFLRVLRRPGGPPTTLICRLCRDGSAAEWADGRSFTANRPRTVRSRHPVRSVGPRRPLHRLPRSRHRRPLLRPRPRGLARRRRLRRPACQDPRTPRRARHGRVVRGPQPRVLAVERRA